VIDAVGRVHQRVLGHVRPAATMVVVAGLADARWRVEIEAEAEAVTGEPGGAPGHGATRPA
jgi:enamine deaminase RidA (YjgF/YER057c/UK114 family)